MGMQYTVRFIGSEFIVSVPVAPQLQSYLESVKSRKPSPIAATPSSDAESLETPPDRSTSTPPGIGRWVEVGFNDCNATGYDKEPSRPQDASAVTSSVPPTPPPPSKPSHTSRMAAIHAAPTLHLDASSAEEASLLRSYQLPISPPLPVSPATRHYIPKRSVGPRHDLSATAQLQQMIDRTAQLCDLLPLRHNCTVDGPFTVTAGSITHR